MSSTELTTTQQEEAAIAFSIQREIIDALEEGRKALWKLAENLYEFDEAHGWMALGYENLSQWLAEPEVSISRASYYRYVRTWRKLVVERQIDANRLKLLDQAKVAIVTDKIAENEVLVDEALADVEALPARDLREKYYGKRVSNVGQPDPDKSEDETSVQVLPDEDAPTRADELDKRIFIDSIYDDAGLPSTETVEYIAAQAEPELELLVGEVLDAYEFPGWVTKGSVEKLANDLSYVLNSGAQFPRVGRRECQVALELAQAWLTTRQS